MKIMMALMLILITSCADDGKGTDSTEPRTPKTITEKDVAVIVTENGSMLGVDLLDIDTLEPLETGITQIQDDGKTYLLGKFSMAYINNGEVVVLGYKPQEELEINTLTHYSNGILTLGDELEFVVSSNTTDIYFFNCTDSTDINIDTCSVHYDKRKKSAYVQPEADMVNESLTHLNKSIYCYKTSSQSICVKANDTPETTGNNQIKTDFIRSNKPIDSSYTIANNFKHDGQNRVYMSQTTASKGEELYYLNVDSDSDDFGSIHNPVNETISGPNGSSFDQIIHATQSYVLYIGTTDIDSTSVARKIQLSNGIIGAYNEFASSMTVLGSHNECVYGSSVLGGRGTEGVTLKTSNTVTNIETETNSTGSSSIIGGGILNKGQNYDEYQLFKIARENGVWSIEIDNKSCGLNWSTVTGNWSNGTESQMEVLGQIGNKLIVRADNGPHNGTLNFVEFNTTEMTNRGYPEFKLISSAVLEE